MNEFSFDLTKCLAKVGTVNIAPNNFESYINKIKKSLDSSRTQFGMAREHCGHRNQYNMCHHDAQHPAAYCKLENCPFLK